MNVKDKVHLLIEQANEHGGRDNIAAVLIEGGRLGWIKSLQNVMNY